MSTLVSHIRLAATLTAVSCSRVFTAHTLRQWNVPHLVDNAQLVVSELVTNAVKATGVVTANPTWSQLEDVRLLHVGIYGHGHSVTIQVWDNSDELPVQAKADTEEWAEGGRGLFIVEALALHVGHFFPQSGGKVVWAELAMDAQLPRLPQREPKEPLNVLLPEADPQLLIKLLNGLEKL
ncbi:ATP-binding protein [Streptomyces sp. AC512_CC834]|uniref:ATP-binding protein n=1 Tax=Streptomyces sp. AC512_CC834 TaxID=2823691 RepID=UPI001C258444|nr:ATP-binding protein [Streptomyces sp. AC512_CC834]